MSIVVFIVHGAGEERLPVAQGQKHFLVILAKVLAAAFDVYESKLARVRPFVQVIHRHGMGVVPAASRWTGSELETALPVRRHGRRTLFLGAVHVRTNQHAMPVHKLRRVGTIDDVDRDRLALLHPQQWPGCDTVITDSRENMRAVEFDGGRCNAKRVIRLRLGNRIGRSRGILAALHRGPQTRQSGLRQCYAPKLEEVASVHNPNAPEKPNMPPWSHVGSERANPPRKARVLQPTEHFPRLNGSRPYC